MDPLAAVADSAVAATPHFIPALPIDAILPRFLGALEQRGLAVLEAAPGAGKTTRVPLAMLYANWLAGRRVIMLEPRRLAARAAARFMASLLGEEVGNTVGYRIRGETRTSQSTRIEVVTEGVLARMLASDASLENCGAVIFDEYHERSLHSDLGLALTLETRQYLRPDLRLVVMSATMDTAAVAALMADEQGNAPVVQSEGRAYPVVTHHRAPRRDERIDTHVSRIVREALRESEGDILVFLPGAAEQRRVAERLSDITSPADPHSPIKLHLLHGSMSLREQDAALAASAPGTRKIVLSTSIAETSLTVEGVRVVVDSGLARIPRFNAAAGLTRLATVRASRASADQRRGRAGRTAAGVCYRLWDLQEEYLLPASSRAEILDADLSSLALELADAGVTDPNTLRWLDPPPGGPFARARDLLSSLGALDASGRISTHGKRMAALPLAPRLAHMVLEAAAHGQTNTGLAMAALLEERDVLRSDGTSTPADMEIRLELLQHKARANTPNESPLQHSMLLPPGTAINRDALRRVQQTIQDLARRVGVNKATGKDASEHRPPHHISQHSALHPLQHRSQAQELSAGALIALAFPDRIAQRRVGAEPRFVLASGAGAVLDKHDSLAKAEWLAVSELGGQPPEYRINTAAPITREELTSMFGGRIRETQQLWWDESAAGVQAIQIRMLDALVLSEQHWRDAPQEAVRDTVAAYLADQGVAAWPLPDAALRLRERMAFLHCHDSSWPDVSDEALVAQIDHWLLPFLNDVRTRGQLERLDWREALLGLLDWKQRSVLDTAAPSHLSVPSGSRIALNYSDPQAPVLAVKLQECFGMSTTPTLLDGRVPVLMHLLSPAGRPVQVTRDMAGFWRQGYQEVRKELRGRYPRHPWPDDPIAAIATRRVKPRGQ